MNKVLLSVQVMLSKHQTRYGDISGPKQAVKGTQNL